MGILEEIRERLERIEARLAKTDAPAGMVPQKRSPLGARKHRAAVARRVADAEAQGLEPIALGAAIVDDVYYLTRPALDEELGERTRASFAKRGGPPSPAANDTASAEEEQAFQAALARGRRARGDRA